MIELKSSSLLSGVISGTTKRKTKETPRVIGGKSSYGV